jgi:hypothetical protein
MNHDCQVFDRDRLGRHPSLGYVMITLTDLADGDTRQLEQRLISRPGGMRATGTLKFGVTLTTWQQVAGAPAAADGGTGGGAALVSETASSDGGDGATNAVSEYASTAPTADVRPSGRPITRSMAAHGEVREVQPPIVPRTGGIKLRMGAGATPNAAAFVANVRSLTTAWAESKTTCLELSRGEFMHLLSDFEEHAAKLNDRVLQAARDEGDDATARQLTKLWGHKEVGLRGSHPRQAVLRLLLLGGRHSLGPPHGC